MKYLPLILITIFSILPQSILAESVERFESQIKIETNRSIQVTETIQYDFGQAERRGIFRNIPLQDIDIANINALQNGGDATIDVSRGLRDITIRIGEEDKYLTGLQEYQISYQVKGAIRTLSDRDELAWQITGTEWEVPINQASATVLFPEDMHPDIRDKVFCYTGVATSTEQNCTIEWVSLNVMTVTSNTVLEPGQGLTLAIGLPLDLLEPATWWDQYKDIIYKIIAGAILVIGIPIGYWFWVKWGKDPKIRKPIVRQYEAPQGMSPAAVIRLKNIYASSVEITATIISLAQQGYISITEIHPKTWISQGEYRFDKLLTTPPTKTFEQTLLDKLFPDNITSVTTKELKEKEFANQFSSIYTQISEEVNQYYIRKPKTFWIIGSTIVGLLGFAGIIGFIISVWIGVSLVLLAIFYAIITYISPQRNQEGTRVLEHILGFEEYIKVAEKDRLQFQEKEHIFFEILPYAIALGLATVWAKAFEGLITSNPDWYHSTNGTIFIPTDFVSTISTSISPVTSVASSGAGSVGAAVGGGGGGSW